MPRLTQERQAAIGYCLQFNGWKGSGVMLVKRRNSLAIIAHRRPNDALGSYWVGSRCALRELRRPRNACLHSVATLRKILRRLAVASREGAEELNLMWSMAKRQASSQGNGAGF